MVGVSYVSACHSSCVSVCICVCASHSSLPCALGLVTARVNAIVCGC